MTALETRVEQISAGRDWIVQLRCTRGLVPDVAGLCYFVAVLIGGEVAASTAGKTPDEARQRALTNLEGWYRARMIRAHLSLTRVPGGQA